MRTRGVIAATLAAGLFLAACGSPQYQYVRDTDTRTAFRVPTDWAVFDKATVLGLSSGPQPDTPDPIVWMVGIDGDPSPSVGNVLNVTDLTTEHPQGLAMVQDLSFTERDSADFQYLRNYFLPIDQLIQNDSNSAILVYEDVVEREGLRGVHLVMQFRESVLGTLGQEATETDQSAIQRALLGGQGVAVLSPDFVQYNQVALVDDATNRVYVLAILCSAECYQRDQADIESAVDSWTVLP